MNIKQIYPKIRRIARAWSIATIAFLLFIFLGHLFTPGSNSTGFAPEDIVAFFFFPIGLIVGLLVGFKKELLGGIITVISFIAFSCIILIPRDAFIQSIWIFLLLSGPGFLFLTNGILLLRSTKSEKKKSTNKTD